MEEEKTTSQIMTEIAAGYLMHNCADCPFYGIREYEIKQRCDSVPLNCKWMALKMYFEGVEKDKEDGCTYSDGYVDGFNASRIQTINEVIEVIDKLRGVKK